MLDTTSSNDHLSYIKEKLEKGDSKMKEQEIKIFVQKNPEGLTISEIRNPLGLTYDSARYTILKLVKKGDLVKKEDKKFYPNVDRIKFAAELELDEIISAIRPMKARTLAQELLSQDSATPEYLMRKSGFDQKNLRVAISILKRKNSVFKNIKYDRKNRMFDLGKVNSESFMEEVRKAK